MGKDTAQSKWQCEHSPWDGYGLMILQNRLNWIKGCNPEIYRIYDEKGKYVEVNGFYWQVEIERNRKNGLRVELVDNETLIKELEASIERVGKRVEEHKRNCVDANSQDYCD